MDAITACACFSSEERGQQMSEGVTSTWKDPATARGCLPSAAPFAANAPGSYGHCGPWRTAHDSQQDASFSRQLQLFRRCAAAGAEAARAAAAAATASIHRAAPAPVPAAFAAADGPETAGSPHVQQEHATGPHGPAAGPAWRLGHAIQGMHAPVIEDTPLHSLGHSSTRPHLPSQACMSMTFYGGMHVHDVLWLENAAQFCSKLHVSAARLAWHSLFQVLLRSLGWYSTVMQARPGTGGAPGAERRPAGGKQRRAARGRGDLAGPGPGAADQPGRGLGAGAGRAAGRLHRASRPVGDRQPAHLHPRHDTGAAYELMEHLLLHQEQLQQCIEGWIGLHYLAFRPECAVPAATCMTKHIARMVMPRCSCQGWAHALR